MIAAFLPEKLHAVKEPIYTEGEVVGKVCQMQTRQNVPCFAPVVRYQTENGECTSTARILIPEWQYDYQNGDKIKIYYEKTCPSVFGIVNSSTRKYRKIFCLTAGISILIAYGVILVIYQ